VAAPRPGTQAHFQLLWGKTAIYGASPPRCAWGAALTEIALWSACCADGVDGLAAARPDEREILGLLPRVLRDPIVDSLYVGVVGQAALFSALRDGEQPEPPGVLPYLCWWR
jgi:hypothetical protein